MLEVTPGQEVAMGTANGFFAGYDGSPGSEQAPDRTPREAKAFRVRAGDTPRLAAGQGAALVTVGVPRHVKIVLDGPARSPHAHQVEDPGRLLRVWALLNSASRELHQAGIPETTVAMLQQQLRANVSELQRSLSPELAGELGRLMSHEDAAPPSLDELCIEYATLLGWAGGLVIAMFDRLEQSRTCTAEASESQKGGNR
jgi:hypothetical protein